MGETVPRDGVVSRGMRGVAADWGPFHSSRKREDMRQWLRGAGLLPAGPEALRRPCHAADRQARRASGVADRDAAAGDFADQRERIGQRHSAASRSPSRPTARPRCAACRGPAPAGRRSGWSAGRLRLAAGIDAPLGVGHAHPVDRRQDQLCDADQKRRDEDQEHEARDHVPELHGQKDQACQRQRLSGRLPGRDWYVKSCSMSPRWPSDSGRTLTGHGRGAGRSVLLFRFGAGVRNNARARRWTVAEAVDRAVLGRLSPGRVSRRLRTAVAATGSRGRSSGHRRADGHPVGLRRLVQRLVEQRDVAQGRVDRVEQVVERGVAGADMDGDDGQVEFARQRAAELIQGRSWSRSPALGKTAGGEDDAEPPVLVSAWRA
jgi:hypothetical protein